METKTSQDQAFQTMQELVTPARDLGHDLAAHVLVTSSTTHVASPHDVESGTLKSEPILAAAAAFVSATAPTAPHAAIAQTEAAMEQASASEQAPEAAPASRAVVARDVLLERAQEWGITQAKAESFNNLIGALINRGITTDEQAAKAIVLADSPKNALTIIDVACKNGVDSAIASRLLDIAQGVGSPVHKVAPHFKVFHAIRHGEGQSDVDTMETLAPDRMHMHADRVDRSLSEYEHLRELYKDYCGSARMTGAFPVTFNAVLEMYEQIGSIDEIEAIFSFFSEARSGISHSAVTAHLLDFVANRGHADFDVVRFLERMTDPESL